MVRNILSLFFLNVLLFKCLNGQQCGVSKIARGNIVGGRYVMHGQFPWFSSIMKINELGEPKYICGGTLISNKLILTAAHCIFNKNERKQTLVRELLVVLGSYNLESKFEVGRETKYPSKIHIHPDWSPHLVTFDADLAIIELEIPVAFSNFIQPICLWDSSFDPQQTSGIVVGYGKSEDLTKEHENIPKVINVPIHSQEDCFLSNPALVKISSKRTFCGGSKDGTGVCIGDSGGGLVIQSNGAFYLRGIVSSSLIDDFSCDVNNYAIFTNILKFKDWIKSFKSEKKDEECGIMSSSHGLINRGEFSSRREFPWMALLSYDDVNFTSSGALISNKHVITRGLVLANWANDEQTKVIPVKVHRLKVYLGTLQLGSRENVFNAKEVFLHPDVKIINENTRTNEVGIILLDASVEFSDFIRPVCLWTFTDDVNIMKNLPIYAVGYGRDASGFPTNIRKHVNVTLVDDTECHKSKYIEEIISENKVFCVVGTENRTPCEFDECLFVKFNGRWYLRGIMFRSEQCNNEQPGIVQTIYHDIVQNIKWIQTIIED